MEEIRYVYLVLAIDVVNYEEAPRIVYAFLEEGKANVHAKQANLYAGQFVGRYNYAYDNPFDPDAKADRIWRAPWYDVESVELKGP